MILLMVAQEYISQSKKLIVGGMLLLIFKLTNLHLWKCSHKLVLLECFLYSCTAKLLTYNVCTYSTMASTGGNLICVLRNIFRSQA